MNAELILSKKQILQLYEMLIIDYPDEGRVILDIKYNSGIGANISATIKYATCRQEERDITDYDLW